MFGPPAEAGAPPGAHNGAMPKTPPHRVVLVPEPRSTGARAGVRRYRLARLSLNPDPGAARDGFDHLKRTYD